MVLYLLQEDSVLPPTTTIATDALQVLAEGRE